MIDDVERNKEKTKFSTLFLALSDDVQMNVSVVACYARNVRNITLDHFEIFRLLHVFPFHARENAKIEISNIILERMKVPHLSTRRLF